MFPRLVAALLVAFATPALAWEVSLSGSDTFARATAEAVATAPDGSVFVATRLDPEPGGCTETVSKMAADTGALLWRRDVGGSNCESVLIAADGHGDVVIAGAGLGAMKLAGTTGAVLWNTSREYGADDDQGPLAPAGLALDPSGDVVVAGSMLKNVNNWDHPDFDFVVAKVSSADGAVRWRTVIDGTPAPFNPDDPSANLSPRDAALAVGIDAAGDVLAAGYVADTGNQRFTVVKLGGTDGVEAWRFTGLTLSGAAYTIAVDAAGNVVAGGLDGIDATIVRLTGGGDVVWRSTSAAGVLAGVMVEDGDPLVVAGSASGNGLVARLAAADGTERWRHQLADGSTFRALAFTGGDPVIVGTQYASSSQVFAVTRLDAASGTEAWHTELSGDRGNGDAGIAVAVGTDGRVIAAGTTTSGTTDSAATVARLDGATGAVAWRVDAGGVGAGDDVPGALALDPSGDVIAAGSLENAATYSDFAVVKLGQTDGTEAWRREINGTVGLGLYPRDQAVAIATDRRGDAITVGWLDDNPRSKALAVVKVDGGDGTERWRRVLNGDAANHDDRARAVVVDGNDDVIVVGTLDLPRLRDQLTVMKLDGATGADRWRRTVVGSLPPWGTQPGTVVVDAHGDVVLAAFTDEFGQDLAVVKLDGATSAERWRYVVDGTTPPGPTYPDDFDMAASVALDSAGDVVVTGTLQNEGTGFDLFVAKVNGTTGVERWRHQYDGSAHDIDHGQRVSVDVAGDVIVSGTAHETTNEIGTVVLKLDGATGAERWRRAVVGAPSGFEPWQYGIPGGSSTVDPIGDVLVTGTTYDPLTGFDFTVAKLAGADGSERWRRRIDGTAAPASLDSVGPYQAMDEYGVDVVTNACGDVFAVGRLVNESAADITVVALDGRNGGDLANACVGGLVDGCPPMPRTGCRRSIEPGTSTFAVDRSATNPARNRLTWHWRGGDATTGADLGSPLGTSTYAFCVYAPAASPQLVLATEIPAGEPCGDKPCWRPGRRGDRLSYLDPKGRHEGITQVQLTARPAGKSSATVRAVGRNVALPAMPLAPPLRVQLNADSGACFETTFDAEGMLRTDGKRLRARAGRP